MNSVSTLSIAIASSSAPGAAGFVWPVNAGQQSFAAILAPFDAAATTTIRQSPAAPGKALPPVDAEGHAAAKPLVSVPIATAPIDPSPAPCAFERSPHALSGSDRSRRESDDVSAPEDKPHDEDRDHQHGDTDDVAYAWYAVPIVSPAPGSIALTKSSDVPTAAIPPRPTLSSDILVAPPGRNVGEIVDRKYPVSAVEATIAPAVPSDLNVANPIGPLRSTAAIERAVFPVAAKDVPTGLAPIMPSALTPADAAAPTRRTFAIDPTLVPVAAVGASIDLAPVAHPDDRTALPRPTPVVDHIAAPVSTTDAPTAAAPAKPHASAPADRARPLRSTPLVDRAVAPVATADASVDLAAVEPRTLRPADPFGPLRPAPAIDRTVVPVATDGAPTAPSPAEPLVLARADPVGPLRSTPVVDHPAAPVSIMGAPAALSVVPRTLHPADPVGPLRATRLVDQTVIPIVTTDAPTALRPIVPRALIPADPVGPLPPTPVVEPTVVPVSTSGVPTALSAVLAPAPKPADPVGPPRPTAAIDQTGVAVAGGGVSTDLAPSLTASPVGPVIAARPSITIETLPVEAVDTPAPPPPQRAGPATRPILPQAQSLATELTPPPVTLAAPDPVLVRPTADVSLIVAPVPEPGLRQKPRPIAPDPVRLAIVSGAETPATIGQPSLPAITPDRPASPPQRSKPVDAAAKSPDAARSVAGAIELAPSASITRAPLPQPGAPTIESPASPNRAGATALVPSPTAASDPSVAIAPTAPAIAALAADPVAPRPPGQIDGHAEEIASASAPVDPAPPRPIVVQGLTDARIVPALGVAAVPTIEVAAALPKRVRIDAAEITLASAPVTAPASALVRPIAPHPLGSAIEPATATPDTIVESPRPVFVADRSSSPQPPSEALDAPAKAQDIPHRVAATSALPPSSPTVRPTLPEPPIRTIEPPAPPNSVVTIIAAAPSTPAPHRTAAVAPAPPTHLAPATEPLAPSPGQIDARAEEILPVRVSVDTASPRPIVVQVATDPRIAPPISVAAATTVAVAPPTPRRAGTDALIATDVTVAGIAQPNAAPAAAIVANAPLDMGRHGWPQAMIERIETLRDAADAVDTSIRIIPDKLGTIDVSVRRDGEVTHVHFAAEQAQTRTILADAQPRLAELADARGLKLGQSSIDAGAGQQQPQHHRAPRSAFVPTAPVRARHDAAATEHRIA